MAAAAEAAGRLPFPFTLTARAENLIRGSTDLDDTIARLLAYERVGADVLFAPGLRQVSQIRAICSAVSSPVNVLITPPLTVAEVAAAGARRISVGGGLAWVAAGALLEAATELRDQGTLGAFARSPGMRGIAPLLGD